MARYTQFKVWLDGKIVDPEEATLSVCSRSRPGTVPSIYSVRLVNVDFRPP
jgi:hypothetical protein